MNGTTLCPHCETRFRISDAQLNAHQGMVRCGHCFQAFDARPGLIPDQPSAQADLPTTNETDAAAVAESAEEELTSAAPSETTEPAADALHADDTPEENAAEEIVPEAETTDFAEATEQTAEESVAVANSATPDPEDTHATSDTPPLPALPEHDDTLDFSQLATPHTVAMPAEAAPAEQQPIPERIPQTAAIAQDELADSTPLPVKSRIWPWIAGWSLALVLLLSQSAYFFRTGLAAHLPAIKPALNSFCQLLNCTVELPQNPELLSIDSSSLDADPAHDTRITLNALLRNRAGYAQAFPVLSLTLNDIQDKPLARRLFLPKEYLQLTENAPAGLPANREVGIKLHLDTADLKPVGYRLELFYPQ